MNYEPNVLKFTQQNAEDNEYPEGVNPSLELIITSEDITGTGAPTTLLIFNNEKGFSPKNIESICSVGRSTKKGNRKRGYIGEKGNSLMLSLIYIFPFCFLCCILENGNRGTLTSLFRALTTEQVDPFKFC